MSSVRTQQVSSEIIQLLTQIINRKIEIPDCLVTCTRTEMTPDLKDAKIFISVLPDNKKGSALVKLNQASNFIQHELKSKIRFYTVPRLKFAIDNGEIKRIKLMSALSEIDTNEE